MNKQIIQKRVIDFFRSKTQKPLNLAVEDSCSEMARLVGCWIVSENPKLKGYIFKGEISKDKFHDILAIVEEKVILIDPTIWQIKKDAKSIFVGEADSVEKAIKLSVQYYGGKWKVSEEITEECIGSQKEYESILEKSISED